MSELPPTDLSDAEQAHRDTYRDEPSWLDAVVAIACVAVVVLLFYLWKGR